MHACMECTLTLRITRRLQAMHMRQSKKLGVLEDPQAVSGHQVRWVRSVSAADLAPFAIGAFCRYSCNDPHLNSCGSSIHQQGGKDGGGDKRDKPNWFGRVVDELKRAPITVLVSIFLFITSSGGLFWLFQREVALKNAETRIEMLTKNAETRIEMLTKNAETRIEMLTRLLDMEYHGDYNTWRGK